MEDALITHDHTTHDETTHRPVDEAGDRTRPAAFEEPGVPAADLDGLQDRVEALSAMDPADVAGPAAEIAEALSRALDEEDR